MYICVKHREKQELACVFKCTACSRRCQVLRNYSVRLRLTDRKSSFSIELIVDPLLERVLHAEKLQPEFKISKCIPITAIKQFIAQKKESKLIDTSHENDDDSLFIFQSKIESMRREASNVGIIFNGTRIHNYRTETYSTKSILSEPLEAQLCVTLFNVSSGFVLCAFLCFRL